MIRYLCNRIFKGEGINIIIHNGLLILHGWVFGYGEKEFAGRQG
jgi:hypothetical protein